MSLPNTFSVTEIDSFQRCRRKWNYGSLGRQSLEAQRPNVNLQLGSMLHKSLELWGKPLKDRKQCPECMSLITFDKKEGMWACSSCGYAKVPNLEDSFREVAIDTISKLVTPETETDYAIIQAELMELGRDMMKNYRTKYGAEVSDVFDVVSSEQEIRVPIPGAQAPDGSQLYIEGTLDKLLRHKQNSQMFILDHKSFGRHPNEFELAMTQQFPRYVWVARQLEWPVVGIAYDGMWKRREIPKGKKFDDLFLRKLLTYSDHEIEEAGIHLAQITTEMASDPAIYHSPKQGCWDCDFRSLCLAETKGEDTDYILDAYFQKRRSNKDVRLDDA